MGIYSTIGTLGSFKYTRFPHASKTWVWISVPPHGKRSTSPCQRSLPPPTTIRHIRRATHHPCLDFSNWRGVVPQHQAALVQQCRNGKPLWSTRRKGIKMLSAERSNQHSEFGFLSHNHNRLCRIPEDFNLVRKGYSPPRWLRLFISWETHMWVRSNHSENWGTQNVRLNRAVHDHVILLAATALQRGTIVREATCPINLPGIMWHRWNRDAALWFSCKRHVVFFFGMHAEIMVPWSKIVNTSSQSPSPIPHFLPKYWRVSFQSSTSDINAKYQVVHNFTLRLKYALLLTPAAWSITLPCTMERWLCANAPPLEHKHTRNSTGIDVRRSWI